MEGSEQWWVAKGAHCHVLSGVSQAWLLPQVHVAGF